MQNKSIHLSSEPTLLCHFVERAGTLGKWANALQTFTFCSLFSQSHSHKAFYSYYWVWLHHKDILQIHCTDFRLMAQCGNAGRHENTGFCCWHAFMSAISEFEQIIHLGWIGEGTCCCYGSYRKPLGFVVFFFYHTSSHMPSISSPEMFEQIHHRHFIAAAG